jgi:Domain of unknown function (DUF4184)
MPFTISHVAVVLPFSRLLARWRLLSAVAIGAMVPDFGLFVPWRLHRFGTHSVEALFTFCLPVGLFAYWLFQYLIKAPVMEVLPEGAYARWNRFSSPANAASILQWILAGLGVLAGALTHLVLDAFTHEGARGVRMIPWLEDPVVEIGKHHVLGFWLLQDGGSLIGLVIVLGVVCYSLRAGHEAAVAPRPLRPAERHAWVLAYAIAALALSAACLLWARVWEPTGHRPLVYIISVAALRGLVFALLGIAAALSWRLRALRLSSARSAA